MNPISQYLVNEILKDNTTLIYGGGFKFPTRGHLEVVKQSLEQHPQFNKYIIFVGSGERDGITQQQSVDIWNIYKKYFPFNIEIIPVPSPVKAVFDYSKENPQENIIWVIGGRQDNEDDMKDFINRTKTVEKYPNITASQVITPLSNISGTKARQALKTGNKSEVISYLPPNISDEDIEQIIDILMPPQQLNENASYSKDIDYKSYIKELTNYMIEDGWNILPLPKIIFKHGDKENAKNFLGKTAYYDPNTQTIVLYTEGRHPKDILRSFSHEMVHHMQNIEDRLGNITTTNTQEDDHLNDIEAEANLKGTMTFRNWTDSLNESLYLDIPKFNQPKTIQQYLIENINEISLSKENAADINGDLTGGTFTVGDITYEYSIKNISNPYKDLGTFYNIQFTPQGEVTSIPKGGKENYIKILSTMYKIIVDFIEKEKPTYIGISSLDNTGGKNYHTVYNRLTDNNLKLIPGYFRKDSNLQFDSPQGKGRFIVLQRKNNTNESKSKEYLKEYKQYVLNELFEKDLPIIDKVSKNLYIVSNGDDIEAKYDIRLEIPERDLWSVNWFFTPDNKNKSPEAWKQVTATSFKVLEDWLKTNNPKAIYISGNTGAKTKLYKMYVDKLQTLLNNRYKIDNSDEDRIVLRSIEEVHQSSIKKRMETLNESYEQALSYWQNGDINSKSKIERWNSIKKKIERQVIQEIYQTKKPNISKSSKKDPFGINQYARELAQGLEEQKQDYIIYCDMDGVIADFDARFRELAKMSPDQYEEKYGIEKFWNFIDNEIGVRFWVGIPWMQDGKQLWEYIKKYKPTLLSAPSRNNESRLGKRLWVKKHIPGNKLVLASRVNKQDYAKPNAILIDDRPDTIVEWENKGGVGILHKSAEETIQKLKSLGL
jgi:PAS domain-containing protein